jgi:sorbitol/mannitol transport system permease protein
MPPQSKGADCHFGHVTLPSCFAEVDRRILRRRAQFVSSVHHRNQARFAQDAKCFILRLRAFCLRLFSAMTTLQPTLTHKPSGKAPKRRTGLWLLLPAVLYLIVLSQTPLVLTLFYSTFDWNILRPDRIESVGAANYLRFFQDVDTPTILLNSVVFSVLVVVLTLVLGMGLALLLNRQFIGRGLARTLIITPFLIMPTVSAVMWKNMLFNPAFGLISSTLAAVGGPRIDWLNDFPMASVIAIVTWQWTPFMVMILLAGLQSLDSTLIEAAQVDGANRVTQFKSIVLPHLTRYIEIGILLEVLFVLNIFGEIFVTTSGGPGLETTTLTFNIFQEAFSRWNLGRASAYGVFAVILANLVTLVFIRVIRGKEQTEVQA